MNFDPAIAAQQAFHHAQEEGELGDLEQEILEAEEAFSMDQGSEAKRAYDRLQQLGERLPQAKRFQEFLIYITWQHVTEGPLAQYFQKGLTLCDHFLKEYGKELEGSHTHQQIVALRESFQSGLGMEEEDMMPEYEEDAFQGGD